MISKSNKAFVIGNRFATLHELYRAAAENLPPDVWSFLDAGAGAEHTMAWNTQALASRMLRPRLMSGVEEVDLNTSFAGLELTTPLFVSPFGGDVLFHPGGFGELVRAAAAYGVDCMVPEGSGFTLEENRARGEKAARIFQLHAAGRREDFEDLAARAAAAGYERLCITVDSPPVGVRDRVLESRFTMDLSDLTANAAAGQNKFEAVRKLSAVPGVAPRPWAWRDLAAATSEITLPFIVKGILTGDDAKQAVSIGATGLLVSNHGGRQLDGVPAAIDQLPEVVEAVNGRVDIAVEGGIRRGSDVVKALAMGAVAVGIGRPAAMALAAGGEDSMRELLDMFLSEMRSTMRFCGQSSVRGIAPDCLIDGVSRY